MITLSMPPRQPKTFKLDERLLKALSEVSELNGKSIGGYVELVLWKHCQGVGQLSINEQPAHDRRGGRRLNAGRKKALNLTSDASG